MRILLTLSSTATDGGSNIWLYVILGIGVLAGLAWGFRRWTRRHQNPELYDEDARGRFVDEAEKRLPRVIEGSTCERIDDLGFEVTLPSGKSFRVHLDNAWRTAAGLDETDKMAVLDEFLLAMQEAAEDAEGTSVAKPEQIMPVIKDIQFLQQILESMASQPPEPDENGEVQERSKPVVQPLVGDLLIFYVVDRRATMRYVVESDLEDLAVDLDGLHALAVENMRGKLTDIRIEGGDDVQMLVVDGTFEGSLLLGDWIWKRLSPSLPGNPVACLPTRDVLLFTGSDSAAGIQTIRKAARELESESPYAVSQTLLEWRDDAWVVYEG